MKPSLESIDGKLSLQLPHCNPIYVDFDAMIDKRLKPGVKPPAILRACKLEPSMRVLDATAGLGRDAALMASTRAEVIMCERAPKLQVLLEDGLKRMTSNLRLTLIKYDAIHHLKSLQNPEYYPDVIYLDPMHPARSKSASVKKDLKALQALLGPDEDVLTLLEVARQYAKKRVVLKWPRLEDALMKPDYTLEGKTVRFDVYVNL